MLIQEGSQRRSRETWSYKLHNSRRSHKIGRLSTSKSGETLLSTPDIHCRPQESYTIIIGLEWS